MLSQVIQFFKMAMSRITNRPSQRNTTLKLRADQPVDSFDQRDSLKSAVSPTIQFVQIGSGQTTTAPLLPTLRHDGESSRTGIGPSHSDADQGGVIHRFEILSC